MQPYDVTTDNSGSVLVWDTATGGLKHRLPGHLIPGGKGDDIGVQAIAFAPDGRTLVWAGNDRKVRFWDMATGKKVGEADMPEGQLAALSPGGRLLALTVGESVSVFDLRTGSPVFRPGNRNVSLPLVFSPDGRVLAVDDRSGAVRLFELASGRERARLDALVRTSEMGFSPDGRFLATAMPDGTVLVWNLAASR